MKYQQLGKGGMGIGGSLSSEYIRDHSQARALSLGIEMGMRQTGDAKMDRIRWCPKPANALQIAVNIIKSVEETLGLEPTDLFNETFYNYENKLKGPF